MAYRDDYDLRLFDEQPYYESVARARDIDTFEERYERPTKKAKKPETEKPKKKMSLKERKRKNRIFTITIGVLFGLVLIVLVSSIIIGQVQLTELNQKINDAQTSLAGEESKFTQLEMKVDANLSTAAVEKYAHDKLNMSKASNSQKEFINLSKGDKAEVTEKSNDNIFVKIGNAIASLWS